jgi:hypothetical protein
MIFACRLLSLDAAAHPLRERNPARRPAKNELGEVRRCPLREPTSAETTGSKRRSEMALFA